MSVLQGLGAFAGGAAAGFGKGVLIKEKIEDIKSKREKKKQEEEILKAGAIILGEEEQPITVEGTQPAQTGGTQTAQQDGLSLANVDYINPTPRQDTPNYAGKEYAIADQNEMGLAFADGGLVDESDVPYEALKSVGSTPLNPKRFARDKTAMVTQVNQGAGLDSLNPQAPQQAQPAQSKPAVNKGYKLSKAYSAMRDKALELGRIDLAKNYQDLGFQVRDKLYQQEVTNAQRQFDLTGDIAGYVKVYNDVIDDGATVEGYEKTPNGYKLRINNNGQTMEQEFTAEQIRGLVMTFNDPASRYASEMESIHARNKKTFETDEEIRKAKALEADKVHTVGLDSVLMKGDGTKLYDGSGNRPQFKNEQDVYAAANDPKDPRHDVAKNIIKQQNNDKIRVSNASRAPDKQSFEEQAYADWAKLPENKGKGKSKYLEEKATWGKNEPLDSVTEKTEIFDPKDGSTKSVSRTSKEPKVKTGDKPKPKQFNMDETFNKFGVN